MFGSRRATFYLTVLAAVSAGVSPAAPTQYRLTYLGTLFQQYAQPGAINGAAQVTGTAANTAFFWNGSMAPILAPGALVNSGLGINSAGQVTGQARFQTSAPGGFTEEIRAFLWDGASLVNLGLPSSDFFATGGAGINDAGWVTGIAVSATHTEAFVWDGATMRTLGTLGGTDSIAAGINNAGFITGYSTLADGSARAFLWNGASMTSLGTLGGTSSSGAAINAAGWVTGASQNGSG